MAAECNKERQRIIQRLIRKLNSNPPPVTDDYLTAASKLTGLHPKVLNDLETNDVFEAKIEQVDRSVIYDALVNFCLTKNKFPCTHELFTYLYGQIPAYLDIGNFRKLLVKMEFLWKKVSPTLAVVIENPLVRFARYNYLKKIQFHRSVNADIYYIDTGSYDSNGNFRDAKMTKEFVIDVLHNDWVQRVIYAVGPNGIVALEEINDFSRQTVEIWVRDSLMPRVVKPGVFIINNNDYNNEKLFETPSLDCLKSDTKNWLDRHGITYDENMSKYELLAIAESSTDLTIHYYKIDEIIKANGHSVLRIPKCIQNVTSAALLARIIDANFSEAIETNGVKECAESVSATKDLFKELIVGACLMYFGKFEKFVADKEVELIETEDKVDNVYDTLIVKVESKFKEGTYEDSDLPSCSDSE